MKYNSLMPILVGITLVIVLVSLGIGQFALSPLKVLRILAEPLCGKISSITDIERQIIWNVRLPRILLALCAGAGLAVSGAALQGVFHNPLVDPHIIGVTSGAAFGGTLAILLSFSPLLLLFSTFTFGLLALALVFAISASLKSSNNLVLVLAGVILSGFFNALVSLLQYLADTEEKLPSIVFWLLGSFATASWHKLSLIIVPLAIAGILLLKLRWRINLLSLGEQDAATLGIPVKPTRWIVLILCAVIVASQVAVSGSIGWVGLIIPHIARILAGADHRRLLPASMWIGGGYMVLVDDLARMLSSAEIPLGIITALLGAPIFALLLYKTQLRGWK